MKKEEANVITNEECNYSYLMIVKKKNRTAKRINELPVST